MKASLRKTNVRFTKEEDRKLKALVKRYGVWDWNTVAGFMENRNPRQCKDRWELYLSPFVNKSQWTKEEENKLISLATSMNQKWVDIAKKFDRRTASQIRNKYRTIMRRENRKLLKAEKENIVLDNKKLEEGKSVLDESPSALDPFKFIDFEAFDFLLNDFETF